MSNAYRVLDKFTKEQKDLLFKKLNHSISERWSKRNLISKEDYLKDFAITSLAVKGIDFEEFLGTYFACLSELTEAIFCNSDAISLSDYEGPKFFAGVEKSWVESIYKSYLEKGFFSEAIELTILMAFIGHEYEVFKIEIGRMNLKTGLFSALLSPTRTKMIEQVPLQTDSLKQLYEAVFSPQPSIGLLKDLIKKAMDSGCYIHPCLYTILERSEEVGLKRYRSKIYE